MKVLNIYGKKDLDVLTCRGKIISRVMDDFFKQFPEAYRENYDKNLATLEIWKVDEEASDIYGGYSELQNLMIIRKFSSFIHELMHVSSTDSITKMAAFSRSKNEAVYDSALIEGFTEYLSSCVALDREPSNYFFETFSVNMLSSIDGIFEPYFIPSYQKFISLFPNKRDIISLMYALNYYSEMAPDSVEGKVMFDADDVRKKVAHSVTGVIDNLIDIQLSFKKSIRENKLYAEKFMDLLSDDLFEYLSECNADYLDYANAQINKRILRRIK